MAYDDYQGDQFDGEPDPAGSGWKLPETRKYQMTPLDEPAPVPAAAKPAVKPVATAGGLLGSLSSAIKSQASRAVDGFNKAVGVATAKPDYQAAAMQRQGFQPADLQYTAPDNTAPANLFYKTEGGKTRYEIPGVKGIGGGAGYAEFQGQRKGGGSFSVVPGLSDGEKQQYAEIQDRERQARQSAAMVNHYATVANHLGLTPNQIVRLLSADTATDRADRQLESKQNQFNQRLELDNDRLDFAKLTAQERAKRSNEWLEFQRWRSEQSDKRRAFKAGKKRNDDLSVAAPVVGDALAALEAVPGAVFEEAGGAVNVGVLPTAMAA